MKRLLIIASFFLVSCSGVDVHEPKSPVAPNPQLHPISNIISQCYYKTHMNRVPCVAGTYFYADKPLGVWMPSGCYIWYDDDGDFAVDVCYRDFHYRVDWTQSEIRIVKSKYCNR